ncbi:MAG: lipocalin family protein [Cytophagales bacterium]|jgi:hypothetical protein|nr:lipocalin family protein [Cytophagales bacterium]
MKKYVLLSVLALVFTACGNNGEDPVPPKAATLSRLIARWQVESFVENGRNITLDCSKDDIWEFDNDGLLTRRFNKGCSGTDNNTDSYSYEVAEDGQSFTIAFSRNPAANTPWRILELNATTLKIRFEEGVGPTIKEYTYRKVN